MMKLLLTLLFCSLCIASEETFFIKDGYVATNDFRKLPESQQRAYVMGLVDGIFLAPFFDGRRALWLEHVISRR